MVAARFMVVLLCLSGVSAARAASIGLFSTPDCSSCNLTVPAGESRTFYIAALTEGVPEGTWMSGALFRVEGLPLGWTASAAPGPGINLTIGDPFEDGAQLAFSSLPEGTCVNLYTVTLSAPIGIAVNDVVLRVTGKIPPWPGYDCPGFWLFCGGACDIFDPFCVDGGTMFVNSSQECSVAVERVTWSQVKSLYE